MYRSVCAGSFFDCHSSLNEVIPHLEVLPENLWGKGAGLAGVFLKYSIYKLRTCLSCPPTSGIGGCDASGSLSIAFPR